MVKFNTNTITYWLISIIYSTSLSLSVFNRFLQPQVLGNRQLLLIVFGLTASFLFITRLFLWQYITNVTLQRKAKIALSFVFIILFSYWFIYQPVKPFISEAHYDVSITATGRHNLAASGSEIWLLAARDGAKSGVLLQNIVGPGWEFREDALIYHTQQPATISWNGIAQGDELQLEFLSHPWSGIVQIYMYGNTKEVDLYSEKNDKITISIPIAKLFTDLHSGLAVVIANSIVFGLTTLFIILLLIGQYTFIEKIVRSTRKSKEIISAWFIAILYSTSISISISNRFLQGNILSKWIILFIVLISTMCLLLLIRWFFWNYIMRIVTNNDARQGILIVFSLLFVCWFAFSPLKPILRKIPYDLKITATSNHNTVARGSEVWLLSAYDSTDSNITIEHLPQSPGWELQKNAIVASGQQPTTLTWNGLTYSDNLQLTFLSHPWSGIVEIRMDNTIQEIDLYSETETNVLVSLPILKSFADRYTGITVTFADSIVFTITFLFIILATSTQGNLLKNNTRRTQRATLISAMLFIGAILCVEPFAWLIAPAQGPRIIDYSAATGYMLVVCGAVAILMGFDRYILQYIPRSWPRKIGFLGRTVLGQPFATWLLVGIIGMIGTWFLSGKLVPDDPLAVWVRIAADAEGETPPNIQLQAGLPSAVPIRWQPYPTTTVAIRPLHSLQQTITILGIHTDRGDIPFSTVKLPPNAKLDADQYTLSLSHSALLNWPEPSRAVYLTFGPGQGEFEVLWYDQRVTVLLGSTPIQVALQLPARWQGWAFTSIRSATQLHIELDTQHPASVKSVEVIGHTPQRWANDRAPGSFFLPMCTAVTGSAKAAFCSFDVQLQSTPPSSNILKRVLTWLGSMFLFLTAAWFLSWFAGRMRSRSHNPSNYYMYNDKDQYINVKSANIYVAMALVWVFVVIFHLLYVLNISVFSSQDSVGYYKFAQSLIDNPRFGLISSARTPGYPVFLAIAITLFGRSAIWIGILQHIALSLLAPLTIWAFARRISLPFAIVIGLCVGCVPALSLTANAIWTESLYAVFASAALIIFFAKSGNLRALLIVGLCIGIAAMIRPTGLIILAAIVLYLSITSWCTQQREKQFFTIIQSFIITIGFVIVVAPWSLHLALAKNTLDLTQGYSNFGAWIASVYQKRVDDMTPVNIMNRAIWAGLPDMAYDPYILTGDFPEVVPEKGTDLQLWYSESLRQSYENKPGKLFENMSVAMLYNTTLIWPSGYDYHYWAEISAYLDQLRKPISANLTQSLSTFTYVNLPEYTPLRSGLIDMSWSIARLWLWISLISFTSIIPLLRSRNFRDFLPAWIYWLTLLISYSSIGMPAERYVVVNEPILYLMIAIVISFLLKTAFFTRIIKEVSKLANT